MVPMMATPSFIPVQVTFWTAMSNNQASGLHRGAEA